MYIYAHGYGFPKPRRSLGSLEIDIAPLRISSIYIDLDFFAQELPLYGVGKLGLKYRVHYLI